MGTSTLNAGKVQPAVTLLLSDARGIYIPRDFVCDANNEVAVDHCAAWGVSLEDAQACQNPDNDWYWEAWQNILSTAKYTDEQGNVYNLDQDDGDLWALCYERMTNEERRNFEMSTADEDCEDSLG